MFEDPKHTKLLEKLLAVAIESHYESAVPHSKAQNGSFEKRRQYNDTN